MAHNNFPIGITYQFIGDIEWLYKLDSTWNIDNSYFIGDANVETKVDLYQPYLQVNHLGKDHGLSENRTIAPNGSFTMKINSCEYYNALKDYNITINHGYLWKSKSIFEDFVNDLFNLRDLYPKSDPMNLICKLIMNSLYGRFAIKPIISKTQLIDKEEFSDFIERNIIESFDDIDKNNLLITYKPKVEIDGELEYSNSIAIASAITAYSRVFMSQFKNNPSFSLLYTDTDSGFFEGELPLELIGSGLGLFKLEAKYKEIVFLGPKIYSGITDDCKTITKIKGFKNSKELTFDEMKSLLNENSKLELKHVKWFRTTNRIEMKEQPYILSSTDNKRENICINGIVVDTKAFKLKNNFKI